MSFWSKLFARRRRGAPDESVTDEDWDEIVYARDEVNFNDEEQRSRYVTGCIEQMSDAAREIDALTGEYELVTTYLTDMEEIEALPPPQKEELDKVAHRLADLERECSRYREKRDRMKDGDFYHMRKQENEVQEGIEKLREAEHYAGLVKQDLRRLDRERHSYEYRRAELTEMQSNLRGMTVIFLSAMVACVVMLAVLRFAFEMDVRIGYFLAIIAGAIALTVVCIKYLDADREAAGVSRSINRLIQLQNKVKIRYVNNANLLEYLRIKYNTDKASTLEKRWAAYQEEKEERKQYAEAEAETEYYQNELMKLLSRWRISDPGRWVGQSNALLDPREMVEIRHDLILRRQALRKQLDYNHKVAENARSELEAVIRENPAYAQEILDMVEKAG